MDGKNIKIVDQMDLQSNIVNNKGLLILDKFSSDTLSGLS